MKNSYKNRIFFVVTCFIIIGVFATISISNSIEQQRNKERSLKLQSINKEAKEKVEHSINQFATLVSGIRALVEQAPEMPDGIELQHLVNNLLSEIQYKDSIVISFFDTTHTFVSSFTRSMQNPYGLVGKNLTEFRSNEELAELDKIMEDRNLHLFEPINLVEGYPGFPLNFAVWKNGVCLGYIGALINFKTIIDPIYVNQNTTDQFAFRFRIVDGPEIDRERVYNWLKVYNTREDPEYYLNFSIKKQDFIYSQTKIYGLPIEIGTAFKERYDSNSFAIWSLYLWSILVIVCAILFGFLMVSAYKRKVRLEKSNKLLDENETKLRMITHTINDVFYLYDIKDKKYDFISENCLEILGVSDDFFYKGKNYTDQYALPIDKSKLNEAKSKVVSGEPYEIEYRIFVDKEIKWINEKSFPIFDEENKIVKNSGICRDVSKEVYYRHATAQKNQELTSSIDYAAHIQSASLSPLTKVKEIFPASFVYYVPKEAIGGDFYMVDRLTNRIGHSLRVLAVADCTGHGVPGAMLTLLCQSFLRQTFIEQNIQTPGQALDSTREKLNEFLNNTDKGSSVSDGMDISLCMINDHEGEMYFSGANSSCILIHQGVLQEFKGDKQFIGYSDKQTNFSNSVIKINKGDTVYLFSDGYHDQFGGPFNKKFQKKRLKETLLELSKKPMDSQYEIIKNCFEDWKGGNEQIDDVTLLGVKI